jgi:hypothetical protein
LEIFTGPDARRQALRYAMRRLSLGPDCSLGLKPALSHSFAGNPVCRYQRRMLVSTEMLAPKSDRAEQDKALPRLGQLMQFVRTSQANRGHGLARNRVREAAPRSCAVPAVHRGVRQSPE